MRFFARLILCVGMACAVAGCDTAINKHYLQRGIGSDLPPDDLSEATEKLSVYVNSICKQAGLGPDLGGGCGIETGNRSEALWHLFVQTGMNDIDRRCDAYLVWLDNIRRAEAPWQKQLTDTHVATQLVLEATSAGTLPMALVATAFGFAADTLTNFNSRLILTVNQSTVQAVVLGKQNDFRKEILGDGTTKPRIIIDNRPAALYALRSYMRLCMPMTIETEINNTLVAYQSGGIDAYKRNPMVTPTTAGQTLFRPGRNFTAAPAEVAQFFDEKLSAAEADQVLAGLCFDKNTTNDLSKPELITELIKIFEQTRNATNSPVVDGKISRRERGAIVKQTNCGDARNFYEREAYANTGNPAANNAQAIAGLIKNRLNRSPAGGALPENASWEDIRKKVQAVRAALSLADVPAAMNNQITRDLVNALARLPRSAT